MLHRLIFSSITGLVLIISAAGAAGYELTDDAPMYYSPRPWFSPPFTSFRQPCRTDIGAVLSEISDTQKRQALAEKWLQVMQQSYSREWQLRQDWLKLQQEQLKFHKRQRQRQAEDLKLRVRLEQLRKENLELEKENLQLRLKLEEKGGQKGNSKKSKAGETGKQK